MDPSVLRLFSFRPTGPGFDAVMRDVLIPDMLRLDGIRGVFVGRQGPDEDGRRLIASLWASHEAMARAVSTDFAPAVFHPELLDHTADRTLESLTLRFLIAPDRPQDVGILRVVRGRCRPGELEGYLDDARRGTIADREAGAGPLSLYLAAVPPDGFVTMSLWDSWDRLQTATGSDRGVIATRHADRLASWDAEHYEIVPGIPGAITEGDGRRAVGA